MVPAAAQMRKIVYLIYCVVYINFEQMSSSLLAIEKIRYPYVSVYKGSFLSAETCSSTTHTFLLMLVFCQITTAHGWSDLSVGEVFI